MSIEHKAFVFDYRRFEAELLPCLLRALDSGSVEELRELIEAERGAYVDPYGFQKLGDDWEEMIETRDPHQYGDFALTKYYDGNKDIGLGYNWESVQSIFKNELPAEPDVTLGMSLRGKLGAFDPGKMGSYFQSPEQVSAHLRRLTNLLESKPSLSSLLLPLAAMLKAAVGEQRGLYITF
jgi:hypothetical protein